MVRDRGVLDAELAVGALDDAVRARRLVRGHVALDHLDVEPAVVPELLQTEEELARHVLQTLQHIPGNSILVVTHRVVIRELTGRDADNCDVVECQLDHGSIEEVKA